MLLSSMLLSWATTHQLQHPHEFNREKWTRSEGQKLKIRLEWPKLDFFSPVSWNTLLPCLSLRSMGSFHEINNSHEIRSTLMRWTCHKTGWHWSLISWELISWHQVRSISSQKQILLSYIVSLFILQFRYAHFLDFLMIIGGTFMAIAGGVALPGHMLMFGRVINQFVYYSLAANNFAAVRNITAGFCTPTVIENLLQNTTVVEDLLRNTTMMPVSGCFAGNQSSGVFDNVLNYVCDPEETLWSEIRLYSIYYVGLATAVLIVIFLATVFWNVSAYRQTRRMRVAFYRAILRQEVGWFDVNEAGGLSTRLAE